MVKHKISWLKNYFTIAFPSKDQLTIAMNAHEEVCVLHKLGGVALQPDVLLACIRIASEKAAYLSLRLSEALRDDTQRRLGSNNERGPSLKDLKTIKSISKQSEKCETHNIQGKIDAFIFLLV